MQQKDYAVLLDDAKDKAYKTLIIVEASVRKLTPYESNKAYSPDELEPYDALSDRFIRCVEMFIKFFKTYDIYQSVTKSDTDRDLLNLMAKLELVTTTTLWINMRDVRNKIVHDYLPEQTKDLFDAIMGEFYKELKYSQKQIEKLRY
jgi:hypothetical protein